MCIRDSVSPGQYVEKGQILAELDVDSLKAQIVQQEYVVEKAQINYEATVELSLIHI